MTDIKIVEDKNVPSVEQVKRYKVLTKQIEKTYADGTEVEIQREQRSITEQQVDIQLAYWQDLKDQISALKK